MQVVGGAARARRPNRSKIEQALWDTPERANIELVYCELSEYVKELEAKLLGDAPTRLGPMSHAPVAEARGRPSREPVRRARPL